MYGVIQRSCILKEAQTTQIALITNAAIYGEKFFSFAFCHDGDKSWPFWKYWYLLFLRLDLLCNSTEIIRRTFDAGRGGFYKICPTFTALDFIDVCMFNHLKRYLLTGFAHISPFLGLMKIWFVETLTVLGYIKVLIVTTWFDASGVFLIKSFSFFEPIMSK